MNLETAQNHNSRLNTVFSDIKKQRQFLLVFTVCYCLYLFLFPTYPSDDILRHSVSWKLNYDLRPLFFESYWPSFNPYIGFDVVAGFFNRFLGVYGIVTIQAIIFVITVVALRKFFSDFEWPLALILMALCFYISDFYSARPKAIVNAMFLLSLAYPLLSPFVVLVSAGFYSLFWLYVPPIIFWTYGKGYRKTAVLIVGASIKGVFFWIIYGGMEYIDFLKSLATVDSLRISGLGVIENMSILRIFALYLFYLYPFFVHAFKNRWEFLTGIYFVLTNQVRYFPSVFPIALRFFRYELVRIPPLFAVLVLMIMPVLKNIDISYYSTGEHYLEVAKSFKRYIRDGRVFASPNLNFAMMYLFAGERNVQVAPAPEIGFTNKELQTLVKNPRCNVLQKYNIHYYVAGFMSNLNKEAYTCLTQVETKGGFILYEVKGR